MTLEDLKKHTVDLRRAHHGQLPRRRRLGDTPKRSGDNRARRLKYPRGLQVSSNVPYESPQRLHLLIEAMRTAFADTRWYVADPSVTHVPIKELISKEYAEERRQHINPAKAVLDRVHGSPVAGSDTVYLCTVDRWGNACSFINSNYCWLRHRPSSHVAAASHSRTEARASASRRCTPTSSAPGKRPYHTIIPGMMTRNGDLYAPFGVMGGFMQPQGHVQVVTNMIDYGMGPQDALDAPRFCILDGTAGGKVSLEEGIPVDTMATLARMGHEVIPVAGGPTASSSARAR